MSGVDDPGRLVVDGVAVVVDGVVVDGVVVDGVVVDGVVDGAVDGGLVVGGGVFVQPEDAVYDTVVVNWAVSSSALYARISVDSRTDKLGIRSSSQRNSEQQKRTARSRQRD